jgi:hypothetical protein
MKFGFLAVLKAPTEMARAAAFATLDTATSYPSTNGE